MQNQNQSNLHNRKLTFTATGLFVIGAILFVIGSTMLFTVSKSELDQELRGENNNENLFFS